jgi:hypothetical protein
VVTVDGRPGIILVPKNTSQAHLTDLVIGLSCAHKKNTLMELGIPPTTPNGDKGPYFVVQTYIFDDPKIATSANLKQWINSDETSKNFASLNAMMIRGIKAHYSGTVPDNGNNTQGSLGYDDSGKHLASYKPIELPSISECPAVAVSEANMQQAAELSKEAKAQAARIQAQDETFGKAPERSGYDGTYRVVKNYLEVVMHDPDSLEMDTCTKVYRTDKGWLVGCDYRGKNAYGAMVKVFHWFTIRQNKVVQEHEESAYTR